MSLVTREQKGSKLSSAEMDDNLLWLSQTLSGSDGTGVIQVTGSSFDSSNTPITSSFFTGDGSALTNITASYLPGIDGSRLLNVTASYISPSIPIPVNGNNTQIQFNKNSALSGSDHLIYNYESQSLEHGATNHSTIGLYSHAEGSTNITLGDYSHAEGISTRTGVYGYTIDSVALNGSNTDITLDDSYSNVSSEFSTTNYILINDVNSIYRYDDFVAAWNGLNTIVTIIGVDLTSIFDNGDIIVLSNLTGTSLKLNPTNADQKVAGDYSHTEGSFTYTINDRSHAEGFRSIAAGLYSHAEGQETIALGNSSHVEGYRTIASGDYQLVVGQYNVASTSQSAFIIGDGTNTGRHNVLFVSQSHFEVSASNMYLQGLVNSSQTYVVAIDTTTGQLSYTLASGVGSLTPAGGANTNIQFNSASAFSGSNNFTYDYDNSIITLTGSMFVSGTISASFESNTVGFFGTSSWAESASQAISSSYVLSSSFASTASFVTTASYVTGSVFTDANPALSASHALTANLATTASYVTGSIFTSTNRALSASNALTSSFSIRTSYVTGSIFTELNQALTASYAFTAGVVTTAQTASYVTGSVFTSTNPALSASYALTASFVTTASYVTGSIFTNSNQALTASHAITASFVRTAQTASYVTGSVFTSTNLALSASNALTASYVTGSIFTSTNLALSASNALTASYVTGSIFTSTNPALTASFATTASYVPSIRASSASATGFSLIGGDYGIVITLSPQFPNDNYAITVTGEDPRSWTVESKTNTQFTIQSNSSVALTGPVYWIAIPFNN
jgi:hypothetical protein